MYDGCEAEMANELTCLETENVKSEDDSCVYELPNTYYELKVFRTRGDRLPAASGLHEQSSELLQRKTLL